MSREAAAIVPNATRAMEELLAASLEAWGIEGAVTMAADGSLVVTPTATPQTPLHVARAPAGVPFRWQVTYAGRTRSVASVAGVLRTVRAVVDRAAEASAGLRVRVGQ